MRFPHHRFVIHLLLLDYLFSEYFQGDIGTRNCFTNLDERL